MTWSTKTTPQHEYERGGNYINFFFDAVASTHNIVLSLCIIVIAILLS